MTSWIALSPKQYGNANFLPRTDFNFCAERLAIPVLLPELMQLLPHMVLGVQVGEQNCVPVGFLALTPNQPLYVSEDGSWELPYIPAMLRAHPFAIKTTDQGQRALCLHEAHLSDDEGTPLFTTEGTLNDPVAKTLTFLEHCEKGQHQACMAARQLHTADVLEQWPLKIKSADGEANPFALPGLHRVNEAALNALDTETYHSLRGGPMALAHAQLFSMAQLGQLARRAATQFAATSSTAPKDPNRLLWEDDDVLINFDS